MSYLILLVEIGKYWDNLTGVGFTEVPINEWLLIIISPVLSVLILLESVILSEFIPRPKVLSIVRLLTEVEPNSILLNVDVPATLIFPPITTFLPTLRLVELPVIPKILTLPCNCISSLTVNLPSTVLAPSIRTSPLTLNLSVKEIEIIDEKEALSKYGSSDSGASLGDILGSVLKKKK